MKKLDIKVLNTKAVHVGLLGTAIFFGIIGWTGIAISAIAGYILVQELELKDADAGN